MVSHSQCYNDNHGTPKHGHNFMVDNGVFIVFIYNYPLLLIMIAGARYILVV